MENHPLQNKLEYILSKLSTLNKYLLELNQIIQSPDSMEKIMEYVDQNHSEFCTYLALNKAFQEVLMTLPDLTLLHNQDNVEFSEDEEDEEVPEEVDLTVYDKFDHTFFYPPVRKKETKNVK
jgi:hypothetical protein